MNEYNITKKETTKEELIELAEMLEQAVGVLVCLGDLEPEDWEIEEQHHKEFGEICSAWEDGLNGYTQWSKDKAVECTDDVPMNIVYNLQDAGWKTGDAAYTHSREIVDDGYGAYNTVLDLYAEELKALGEDLPDYVRDELESR